MISAVELSLDIAPRFRAELMSIILLIFLASRVHANYGISGQTLGFCIYVTYVHLLPLSSACSANYTHNTGGMLLITTEKRAIIARNVSPYNFLLMPHHSACCKATTATSVSKSNS